MRECKRQSCRVFLLTVPNLSQADWPRDAIDDVFYMPTLGSGEDLLKGVSYLARTERIDRIVALDDFDVEAAAYLREHLRTPGMGDTTARYFRDKLAMRVRARSEGVRVPEFVHVLNYDAMRNFMERVPPPWVLKPRSQASAIGIKKIGRAEDLWPILDQLGDRQSFHLMEQYVPGEVYHVDSIVFDRTVQFAIAHKYARPPMNVAHEGGIFITRNLPRDSADARQLLAFNTEVIRVLGLVRGVTHTEFIKGPADDGFYFLETAARVGGAHIVETIEAATGINLWREWARVEIAGEDGVYRAPPHDDRYAGIVLSLARQERPDTSAFQEPEIVYRVQKRHHVGLIVASEDPQRVDDLLQDFSRRFYDEFFASQPLPDKPWH